MKYYLNLPSFGGIFAVPCQVADRFLNEASPDDLKVLLYLLRNGAEEPTAAMSDFLGLTVEKLGRSFEYWTQKGILRRMPGEEEAASAALPARETLTAAAEIEPKKKKEKPEKRTVERPVSYGPDEIAGLAKADPNLKFLLEAASGQLGRLLSDADCSSLVALYQYAGLPADVILMLVEYCITIGKSSMRYIERTGFGWADEGIDSHERAEEKICRLEEFHSFQGKIRAVMGISGRSFTKAELEHISRWQKDYHSAPELVAQAYEICVKRLGRLSFDYINSILKNWKESGIKTEAQLLAAQKKQKAQGSQPSYDIDEFVRLSVERLSDEAAPGKSRNGTEK